MSQSHAILTLHRGTGGRGIVIKWTPASSELQRRRAKRRKGRAHRGKGGGGTSIWTCMKLMTGTGWESEPFGVFSSPSL
ncbi:unnamed protein product [Caretta caretta]